MQQSIWPKVTPPCQRQQRKSPSHHHFLIQQQQQYATTTPLHANAKRFVLHPFSEYIDQTYNLVTNPAVSPLNNLVCSSNLLWKVLSNSPCAVHEQDMCPLRCPRSTHSHPPDATCQSHDQTSNPLDHRNPLNNKIFSNKNLSPKCPSSTITFVNTCKAFDKALYDGLNDLHVFANFLSFLALPPLPHKQTKPAPTMNNQQLPLTQLQTMLTSMV